MNTDKLELLLAKGSYAFVIGNGINQYAKLGTWSDLLQKLAGDNLDLKKMISKSSESKFMTAVCDTFYLALLRSSESSSFWL
jgi:hypothetical protein